MGLEHIIPIRKDRYLSVSEVAKHAGCHRDTILRAIHSGQLADGLRQTPGGHYRLRQEAVDQFLRQCEDPRNRETKGGPDDGHP